MGVRKVYKYTKVRQVGGDDGYCWAVFVNGVERVNGLTRGEVPYYRDRWEREEQQKPASQKEGVMTEHYEMKVDRTGMTEDGRPVPVGTLVVYLGHLPGGIVSVRLPDGTEVVMHPACFKELRE